MLKRSEFWEPSLTCAPVSVCRSCTSLRSRVWDSDALRSELEPTYPPNRMQILGLHTLRRMGAKTRDAIPRGDVGPEARAWLSDPS